MQLRKQGEEGRMWDWPNWTGPGAGAVLGAFLAVELDDKTVGILGGIAIFVFFVVSDFLVRRRNSNSDVQDTPGRDGVDSRRR